MPTGARVLVLGCAAVAAIACGRAAPGKASASEAAPSKAAGRQAQAYKKVTSAGDADSMKKAMEELTATTKNDPLTAGNSERDPMKGATDVIAASSKPQGDEFETKARAIGAELARKALARLGGSAA